MVLGLHNRASDGAFLRFEGEIARFLRSVDSAEIGSIFIGFSTVRARFAIFSKFLNLLLRRARSAAS